MLSAKVPIFCVEFWELSNLTRDLSKAEKKINVVTSWADAQNDIYFTQMAKVVILSENSCHLSVAQLVTTFMFIWAWDKPLSKWDNSRKPTQKMRSLATYNLCFICGSTIVILPKTVLKHNYRKVANRSTSRLVTCLDL